MSLQNLERRFGITAVKQGYITAEQLIEALATQIMEELEGSEHRLIGEILLEKEYLTDVQMKGVLKFLGISEDIVTRLQHYAAIKADEITGRDIDAVSDP